MPETDNTQLDDSSNPVTVDYSNHMDMKQLAAALGESYGRIDMFLKPQITKEYFGGVKHKGKMVYPPSCLPAFREALILTPGALEKQVAKLRENGGTAVAFSVANPASQEKGIAVIQDYSNTLTPEIIRESIVGAFQKAVERYVPVLDDRLLTRKEVREKLGGTIPKHLKPIVLSPARWSNNQVNRYIGGLLEKNNRVIE